MLLLLSPAKSLDYETPLPEQPHTPPLFTRQSRELITLLRQYPVQGVAELMDLSDKLAALNVGRYAAWSSRASLKNARQAVLAFDGDVYDGLSARTLDTDALQWAQAHLCILSGLYGVLRPLDLMQPYRLEMGTALHNPHGRDLYAFWGTQIADYLNQRLRRDPVPLVVNLASQEYFKAVDRRALKAPVLECVFQESKGDQCKVVGLFAKRARGMMARFAVEQRIEHPQDLRAFDRESYRFDAQASSPERYVFRRAQP